MYYLWYNMFNKYTYTMPPEQRESVSSGSDKDEFIDNLLDVAEERLDRLDDLIDTIDADTAEPPSPDSAPDVLANEGDTNEDLNSSPSTSNEATISAEPLSTEEPGQPENSENKLVETFKKLLDELFKYINQKFPKLGKLLGIEGEEKRKVTKSTMQAVRSAGEDGTLDDADIQTIARAVNADPAFAGADVGSRMQGIQALLAGETSIKSLTPEQTVAFERALRGADVGNAPSSEPTGPDASPPEDDFVDIITPPAIGDLKQQTELLLDTAAMEKVNRTIEAMDLSETERSSLVIEVHDTLTLTKYPPTYVGNVRVSYVPDNQDGTGGEESDRIGSEVPWSYEGVWGADQEGNATLALEDSAGPLDPGYNPSASGIDASAARAEEQSNRDEAISKAILDALKTIKIGDPVVLGGGLGIVEPVDPGFPDPIDPLDPDPLDPTDPPNDPDDPFDRALRDNAERMQRETEALLQAEAKKQVNEFIESLSLSETERKSLVIDVQDLMVLTKLPPTYTGAVSVSYVPDTEDGKAGKELDRIGATVPWSYEGVAGAGGDVTLINYIPPYTPPQSEENREEQRNRDTAISAAIIQALGKMKNGEPVSFMPNVLDPWGEPMPIDPPVDEGPELTEDSEKEQIETFESLLKLVLAGHSLLKEREEYRSSVRNSISVIRNADGTYTVQVDTGLTEGNINAAGEQAVRNTELFPYQDSSSKLHMSAAMNFESGDLREWGGNFEMLLNQREPEAPQIIEEPGKPPTIVLRPAFDFGGVGANRPDPKPVPPLEARSYNPGMGGGEGGNIDSLSDATPYYTIDPALSGNFKTGAYSGFANGRFSRENPVLQGYSYPSRVEDDSTHTVKGYARGVVSVPLPLGYRLQENGVRTDPATGVQIYEDQYGVAYLRFASNELVKYSLDFGKDPDYELTDQPSVQERERMLQNGDRLQDDIRSLILELSQDRTSSMQEKAGKLSNFILREFSYSHSRATSDYYRENGGRNFLQRIDKIREADCDVANAYFVALCREVGIPARLTSGYKAQEQLNGNSILSPHNAHGWAEIWNGSEWEEFDATPNWRIFERPGARPPSLELQKSVKEALDIGGTIEYDGGWEQSRQIDDLVKKYYEGKDQTEGSLEKFTNLNDGWWVGQDNGEQSGLSLEFARPDVQLRDTSTGNMQTLVKFDHYDLPTGSNKALTFSGASFGFTGVPSQPFSADETKKKIEEDGFDHSAVKWQ
jgi:transglutaminase-like putative cysteine protease